MIRIENFILHFSIQSLVGGPCSENISGLANIKPLASDDTLGIFTLPIILLVAAFMVLLCEIVVHHRIHGTIHVPKSIDDGCHNHDMKTCGEETYGKAEAMNSFVDSAYNMCRIKAKVMNS